MSEDQFEDDLDLSSLSDEELTVSKCMTTSMTAWKTKLLKAQTILLGSGLGCQTGC